MTATIQRADARQLPLADGSVDAVVCDPPYELGFMGRAWDSTGVAYDQRTWREALRVLKPGGHLLAFGGSRTWHRLCVAIEDAGFEIRDSIAWLYGSGFPKSLDVSKAIDKAAGAERAVIGTGRDHAKRTVAAGRGATICREGGPAPIGQIITAPATDDAHRWQGWGTGLKPAFEPIVVARKPLAGTVASNVLAYGTGALNIDGCRVGNTVETWPVSRGPNTGNSMAGGVMAKRTTGTAPPGRWPSNVVLTHQPLLDDHGQIIGDACAGGCVAGCPVAELDQQSGTLHARGNVHPSTSGGGRMLRPGPTIAADHGPGDSGGASRYFPTFRYQAKADDWERPVINGAAHPTVKPLDLIRWLCRLITPPGGLILDQFAGSGTTLEAALLEGFRAIGGNNTGEYDAHIAFRIDRARRLLQPGVAKLARTKPTEQLAGQADLFEFVEEPA